MVFPKGGRPSKWSHRILFEAILWMIESGAQWRNLPGQFPPWQTVYRRYRQWQEQGVLSAIRDTLLKLFYDKLEVCFVDATFVRACLGGDQVGLTKHGKGSKIMALVDSHSNPVAHCHFS